MLLRVSVTLSPLAVVCQLREPVQRAASCEGFLCVSPSSYKLCVNHVLIFLFWL